MDKARFLEVAHYYYALGIATQLRTKQKDAVADVTLMYGLQSRNRDGSSGALLKNRPLFDKAIAFLAAEGIIEVIYDDFAPPLLRASPKFQTEFDRLTHADAPPFSVYMLAPDKTAWLTNALVNLEAARIGLRIADEDYEEPDRDWEPLPLDRDESTLITAIAAVDDVIEHIRGDNGYAENLPEERAFILDGLTILAARLKGSGTVSAPFIRTYGIEPLMKLARRFGTAAIGVVAVAAAEAIQAWVRQKVGGALDWLFKG
jgi:hypothetical protein